MLLRIPGASSILQVIPSPSPLNVKRIESISFISSHYLRVNLPGELRFRLEAISHISNIVLDLHQTRT
jgi:hypothetical protein